MSNEETQYRLRLAEGFLEEARQDLQLGRWRSCADNSQLADLSNKRLGEEISVSPTSQIIGAREATPSPRLPRYA